MLSVKKFFSVASLAALLPFVPVCLSSVSDPCSYPSCLYLPLRTSFFLAYVALKIDVFTSPGPFFLILRKSDYRQISPLMIFPCLLTSTGSVSRRTTSSSTLLSSLKAMAVMVPMKLKKTITVGINWRRAINAPMMMKIQRVIPCSLKVIDLANAGELIRVINPIINPTIDPILVFFNYYLLSFVVNLNECISSQF